jgi:hypothetical protein
MNPIDRVEETFVQVALKGTGDTVGTDYIAGTGTTVALVARNLTTTGPEYLKETRDIADGRPSGSKEQLVIGSNITISFDIEMAASGTNTAPVVYRALFLMAGYQETVQADRVEYTRVEDESQEVDGAMRFLYKNEYHVLQAGKANIVSKGKADETGMYSVEVKGIYGGAVEALAPVASFSGFQTPVPVNSSNTTLLLDGDEMEVVSFEHTLGNTLTRDPVRGRFIIEKWEESLKLVVLAPRLSTFDPYAILEARARFAVSLQHGISAGAINGFTSPDCVLEDVKPAEHHGRKCHELIIEQKRSGATTHTTR